MADRPRASPRSLLRRELRLHELLCRRCTLLSMMQPRQRSRNSCCVVVTRDPHEDRSNYDGSRRRRCSGAMRQRRRSSPPASSGVVAPHPGRDLRSRAAPSGQRQGHGFARGGLLLRRRVATVQLFGDQEAWPAAVCSACARPSSEERRPPLPLRGSPGQPPRMLQSPSASAQCEIQPERHHTNVEWYGNTGAASCGLRDLDGVGEVGPRSTTWLVVGVGAGLTWSGYLLRVERRVGEVRGVPGAGIASRRRRAARVRPRQPADRRRPPGLRDARLPLPVPPMLMIDRDAPRSSAGAIPRAGSWPSATFTARRLVLPVPLRVRTRCSPAASASTASGSCSASICAWSGGLGAGPRARMWRGGVLRTGTPPRPLASGTRWTCGATPSSSGPAPPSVIGDATRARRRRADLHREGREGGPLRGIAYPDYPGQSENSRGGKMEA